jgi:uncharacterized protein YsxB (DUF464 family)
MWKIYMTWICAAITLCSCEGRKKVRVTVFGTSQEVVTQICRTFNICRMEHKRMCAFLPNVCCTYISNIYNIIVLVIMEVTELEIRHDRFHRMFILYWLFLNGRSNFTAILLSVGVNNLELGLRTTASSSSNYVHLNVYCLKQCTAVCVIWTQKYWSIFFNFCAVIPFCYRLRWKKCVSSKLDI